MMAFSKTPSLNPGHFHKKSGHIPPPCWRQSKEEVKFMTTQGNLTRRPPTLLERAPVLWKISQARRIHDFPEKIYNLKVMKGKS
jgi:hypothetical protein